MKTDSCLSADKSISCEFVSHFWVGICIKVSKFQSEGHVILENCMSSHPILTLIDNIYKS